MVKRVRQLRRESLGFAIGSACFAVGALPGYLGWVGTTIAGVGPGRRGLGVLPRRQRAGDPRDRPPRPRGPQWWTAWLNMVGSVAFAASAVASFVLPSTREVANATLTNAGTFVGALCFVAGALLMRPPSEGRTREDQTETVTGNVRIHATVPRNST